MCGVTLRDRKRTAELVDCLVVSVDEVVCHGRLRWYGHVEHKDKSDWVSECRELQVEVTKSKGSGRKTWYKCVKVDIKRQG